MSAPYTPSPTTGHGGTDPLDHRGLFASGGQMGGHPVPERAPLPRPERLNRNVLTVGAVLMGVLVLAAVILVPPNQPAANQATATRNVVEQPTPETYLEQPAAAPSYPSHQQTSMLGASPMTTPPAPATIGGGYPSGPAPSAPSGDPYAGVYPSYVSAAEPPQPVVSEREAAYRAALTAPLAAGQGAGVQASEGATTSAVVPAGYAPGTMSPGGGAGAGQGPAMSGATRGRAYAGVDRPTVIATSVQPAPGPYALQAGTLIPAVLLTEINSDLPGDVLAQVSRDVFDSRTQQQLLVPKSSRLLGSYENEVTMSQERLFVRWTRLIFPDGRSVVLPGLETKDRSGAAGVRDQVERHSKRNLGTAALVSLVSAGAQLSQPNGGYGPWGSPSAGQVVAGAAGQQLAEVTAQILRRNADAPPTLRVRQGMPFNVFLAADLTFPGPYAGAYARGAAYAPVR